MVFLRDIKGQNNAVRYLLGNLSSNRIAGAYLFSGPQGVGRALSAKAFLMALICQEETFEGEACGQCISCRRVSALEHPDITWIQPEKKGKAIKIDQIRKVKEILSLKPYESSVSACVIEDAHMMTEEASNALLKVLEEPPGASLLILISDKKQLLLDTVVSRCSEVRFGLLPQDDTVSIISAEATDVDENKIRFLAYFSQGSPGRALEMLEEGLEERKNDLISLVSEISNEENACCMNWDVEDKEMLLEDLEMLIMLFRDITVGRQGLESMVLNKDIVGTDMYRFFSAYPEEKIYGIVERLIGMKRALLGNVNVKLAAQALPSILK